MKIVIVGGVAGGATAAARMRRISEDAEIILFEKGEYISYANCGLPYHIGGTIAEREKLLVQTVDGFARRLHIDVRTRQEVIAVHPSQQTVEVRRPDGEVYTESYDRLLLSPGATPVRPPLPGIDTEGIFTLRNVTDTDRIKAYMNRHAVKRTVIIGGGFIGLEMAENLHRTGSEVAIVEMADQVMAPMDYSMAALVHQHLTDKGVRLYLKQAVSGFEQTGNGIKIQFASGLSLEADMVLLSIGVRALTHLAQQAGLTLGQLHGIQVNEYLQTSDEHIYAVGDAIEYPHPITGKPWLNFLAGPANRQARIVADNMLLGNRIRYEGAIGTAIAQVFDLTVASTGLAAKRLKAEGMPYRSVTVHPNNHAGYYPGATPMTIKLIFHPEDGRIYGAQIIGRAGVDKRIDVIASAIKHGDTIYDLTETEQAYAPPYSSAKDPVAMAAYAAQNILEHRVKPLYWRELRDADSNQTTLVDVRTPEEFALGSIPGAVNIPLDDLRDRLNDLPRDRKLYLFCGVGLRGYLASNILLHNGFTEVYNLSGGLKVYKAATAPLPAPQPFGPTPAAPVLTAFRPGKKEEGDLLRLDACGLSCPGPILKLKNKMDSMTEGQQLEVTASDPGFPRDAEAWCQTTGNAFIGCEDCGNGQFKVLVSRGSAQPAPEAALSPAPTHSEPKGKTFILFNDDLDKALATFILANGAAATGTKVTIFFTFWGLNVLKKEHKPAIRKDIWGRMFGWMLPSSSLHLKLSKMNMFGIGSRMMRHLMQKRGVDSLESLRQQALDNGVEFMACQMAMDVMGVKQEELIDGVSIGGVATYMNRAEQAGVNLFI